MIRGPRTRKMVDLALLILIFTDLVRMPRHQLHALRMYQIGIIKPKRRLAGQRAGARRPDRNNPVRPNSRIKNV
jgi:hypothetical protein